MLSRSSSSSSEGTFFSTDGTVLPEGEITQNTKSVKSCGRIFRILKEKPKLRSGIALSLFVLFAIGALLVIPGGMGIAGHLLGTTFMAKMATNLTLGGAIAMTATGGISTLLALAILIWPAVESCIACQKAQQNHEGSSGSVDNSKNNRESIIDQYLEDINSSGKEIEKISVDNTGLGKNDPTPSFDEIQCPFKVISSYMPTGSFAILEMHNVLHRKDRFYVVAYRRPYEHCIVAWPLEFQIIGGPWPKDQPKENHELSSNSCEAATEWILAHKNDLLEGLSPYRKEYRPKKAYS